MPATWTWTRSSNTCSKLCSILSLPVHSSMAKRKGTDEKKSSGLAGQETERYQWSSADESHLLNYIATHKAKGGDGLNFDRTFWAQAAIDVVHTTTSGVPKTADARQQKWARVCIYSCSLCHLVLTISRCVPPIMLLIGWQIFQVSHGAMI